MAALLARLVFPSVIRLTLNNVKFFIGSTQTKPRCVMRLPPESPNVKLGITVRRCVSQCLPTTNLPIDTQVHAAAQASE